MTDQIATDYELACMTDPVLLELQANTLAIPSGLRTRADVMLLDDISRHWQVRKSGGDRGIRACFPDQNRALAERLRL